MEDVLLGEGKDVAVTERTEDSGEERMIDWCGARVTGVRHTTKDTPTGEREGTLTIP